MLLSSALITTRDGLIGSETVSPGKVPTGAPTLEIGKRLLRLTRDHRASVLAAEILEDLSFDSKGDDPRSDSAVLSCRDGGTAPTYVPLVELIRPRDDDLGKGVSVVATYAELRGERLAEIEAQKGDLISFYASVTPLCPDRCRRTVELLGFAMEIAGALGQRFKLAFACPRPYFFSPLIQPMIPTPEHGTWPSGHATQAFTLATVLAALLGDGGPVKVAADSQLYRLAARIAANRTIAGVHFTADSATGAMLGIAIGKYLAARASRGKPRAAGEVQSLHFDGTRLAPGADFHFRTVHDLLGQSGKPHDACRFGKPMPVRPAPLLAALWREAREELAATWS